MPVFLISGPDGQGSDKLALALTSKPVDIAKARHSHPISYIIDLNNVIHSFAREEMCVILGIEDIAEVAHVRRAFPERTIIHCHCRVDVPVDQRQKHLAVYADFVVAEHESMSRSAFMEVKDSPKKAEMQ